MEHRRCAACGRTFRARSQVPQQRYCSEVGCQRERRRLWQRAKRASDADYRENQARAQRAWAAKHREYWREYRRRHPGYCERNREAARRRQREGRQGVGAPATAEFAKMDASTVEKGVPSGTYRLVPATAAEFAKMDACLVEITLVPRRYAPAGRVCKERT
jgi:hypothetical protein